MCFSLPFHNLQNLESNNVCYRKTLPVKNVPCTAEKVLDEMQHTRMRKKGGSQQNALQLTNNIYNL